jgi:hypothetical protein
MGFVLPVNERNGPASHAKKIWFFNAARKVARYTDMGFGAAR